MSEFGKFLLLLLVLTLLVLAADRARLILNLQQRSTRRFVHVAVALVVFWTPFLFHDVFYPALLGGIFVVVNFASLRLGIFKGMNVDRTNLGTVYYPVSFLVLVLLFWDKAAFIVSTAMLIMGVGDPLAAIVGSSVSNTHEVSVFGERKTFEGTAAMFLASSAMVIAGLAVFRENHSAILALSWSTALAISVSIGIMVAAVELVSPRATDNFSVPLIASLLIYVAVSNPALFDFFMIGELLAALVAGVSYLLKFLTRDGAVATFIVGGFIFGFGGWEWAVPIMTFFIIGSISSRLFASKKSSFNLLYEKGHTRDSGQVFANGGVGVIAVIGSIAAPGHQWFLAYVGSLAAVTADTVATEFGVFSRRDPFSPTVWQRVAKGTSGGISAYGSTAGLLAAAVLGILALPLAGGYSGFLVRFVVLAAASGAVGSFADSILGGTLQSQYRCPACGKITERKKHCGGNPTKLENGFKWINNDVVNFVASLVGAVTMPLLFK